ncbi:MAG TPA: hypothetical protein VFQ83_05320, partial [Candidatus Udaeobacter sp.]|nr:hypothetical protein [Candidatus Udaeobacter sp.]
TAKMETWEPNERGKFFVHCRQDRVRSVTPGRWRKKTLFVGCAKSLTHICYDQGAILGDFTHENSG